MAGVRLLNICSRLTRQSNFTLKGLVPKHAFSTSYIMAARVHLNYEVKDGVGIIKFDSPNSKVNTLGTEVMDEFSQLLQEVQTDGAVRSIVVSSGKPECFIAGADITMLQACKSAEEIETLSLTGQKMLQRVEDSPKPVVAAIMGSCLGGGLEVALACHYRLAMNDQKTVLGTPEVLLGLLPGAGGTQRLQKLVGIPASFDMMLTGRNIRAYKAKRMGLVDELLDPLGPGSKQPAENSKDYLHDVAVKIAKGLADGTIKRKIKKKNLMEKVMNFVLKYDYGKNYLLNQVKTRVMKQTGGLYPAPLKIIDVVKTTMFEGTQAGYAAETKAFGELGMTKESSALMGLFLGQTACKKNAYGKPEKKVETLAVLGAGLMGAGIVQVSVDKGYNVIMKDMAEAGLIRGQQQVEKGLETAVKKKKLTIFEKDRILSNLDSTLSYDGFKNVDMVIEAVFEDINIKHKVIQEVEKVVPAHCIIASNTSALPISDVALGSIRPENVVGMHYFSPVDKMELVEIIPGKLTSDDTVASAVAVSLKQGKMVIVVGDGPAFYTTRAVSFYIAEGLSLVMEGVEPTKVDSMTKAMGFPVGPLTLADEVGLDVAEKLSQNLLNIFGDRCGFGQAEADMFKETSLRGFKGRKTNKGFYLYEEKSKKKPVNQEMAKLLKRLSRAPKLPLTDENIKMRILSRFVNEAVMCLEEGILRSPVDGDIGAVFGLGFPPCLGGPFRYLDNHGAKYLVSKMNEFEGVYGSPFHATKLLVDHANDSSLKFHKKFQL